MTEKKPTETNASLASPNDAESSKNDLDLDGDEFDVGEEFITLPSETETIDKKANARRKIEMYWEKKQLREQLGDMDFDF